MNRDKNRQIAVHDELRCDILSGRYATARFPSERALAMRFRVSRSTIARCLSDLVREGLVLRSHGRGTFITRQGLARKIGLIVPGLVPYSEYFQPICISLPAPLVVRGSTNHVVCKGRLLPPAMTRSCYKVVQPVG